MNHEHRSVVFPSQQAHTVNSQNNPAESLDDQQLLRHLLIDTQRLAEELSLLEQVRSALAREMELGVIIRTVVEATAQTFGYTQVSVWLRDGDVLVCQHQVGYPEMTKQLPIMHGVNGRVARTGQPALVVDVGSEPDFIASMDGVLSEVCVPLFDQSAVVGTLNVESTHRVLNETDLRLIVAIGEHVNIAITRARLFGEARESEERFRLLSDAAFEGIVVHEQGIILDVNAALAHMFGYEPAELIGKHMLDFIVPEVHEFVLPYVQSGFPKPYELPVVKKDGTIFSIEAAGRAIPYHGRTVRVTAAHDITERKRAEDELRQRAEQLEAIHETSLDITAPHGLPTVLHKIVERATHLLGCASGGLYLCEPERRDVRCVVSYNTYQDYTGVTLRYGEGAAGIVAETGQPLNIADYRVWSERAGVFDDDRPFGAVLNVPMIWQGQVIGVLTVNSSERQFTQSDMTVLALFADHAAIAVENARLFDEVRRLAYTDELTGISNRRQLFQLGEREFARTQRYGRSLVALMLDLDRFKRINDAHGHAVGDQMLHAVAQYCLANIRAIDIVGRYGGEEFAILLPDTDLLGAVEVAERLRESIAIATIPTTHGDMRMTVSIGIACIGTQTRDLPSLLDQADRALYAAKQAGRNRVEVWTAEVQ